MEPMIRRNSRSRKLAFLLIAFAILAGVQPGPTEAQDIEQLRKLAEQGNASAQHILGNRYRIGQGVPQDYDETLKWYRLAAAQGIAETQYNLGVMYYKGEGIPQNFSEAVKWFRKAADQNYAQRRSTTWASCT